MKINHRLLLRFTGGLAVLTVVTLLLCLDRLDVQPYFTAPYYAETINRFEAQTTNTSVVRGELAAGFGRALLTPTLNVQTDEPEQGRFRTLPLAGYGNREGKPATGMHDDLYVKAVAFRVQDRIGVMIGADALIIPREVAEAALAQLEKDPKLRREQVYFSATHTHSSLGGWGEGLVAEAFAGEFQPGVRTWFADRLVTAARAAVADLTPAAMQGGSFAAPEFVRNRLVGRLGRVDSEFSYLCVKQADGHVAVLGSYAAHATVLSGRNMEFSGDYPGYWQRAVERATGGMAVFVAGGVGSHSPVPGSGGFIGAEQMGQALASRVLIHLDQARFTNIVSFGTLGVEVTLPELHARLTDGIRLRPWLARRLLPVSGHTFLQAFRLDASVWISTPCDFSGELALDLKDSLRARGGVRAVLTSFNGDYIGYVIPHRYYHQGGYEPRLMSFFGPNVPDYFQELIRTLALRLTEVRLAGTNSGLTAAGADRPVQPHETQADSCREHGITRMTGPFLRAEVPTPSQPGASPPEPAAQEIFALKEGGRLRADHQERALNRLAFALRARESVASALRLPLPSGWRAWSNAPCPHRHRWCAGEAQ